MNIIRPWLRVNNYPNILIPFKELTLTLKAALRFFVSRKNPAPKLCSMHFATRQNMWTRSPHRKAQSRFSLKKWRKIDENFRKRWKSTSWRRYFTVTERVLSLKLHSHLQCTTIHLKMFSNTLANTSFKDKLVFQIRCWLTIITRKMIHNIFAALQVKLNAKNT